MANANPRGIWLYQLGIMEGKHCYLYDHFKNTLKELGISPELYVMRSYPYIRVVFKSLEDKNLFLLSGNLKVVYSGSRGKRVYRYNS